MRLDKFLKVSRIIKRRSIANEVCDAGKVSSAGRVLKASYQVSVGDKLSVTIGERTHIYEVLIVAEPVGKDAAREMTRLIS
ncbi:MAG: S4 domain-containing protein [Oscillospiraceae bacterium]|nr:S4 domain-containing protein [Oscillospiraceae bacterium]